MLHANRSRRFDRLRRGVAATECALVLPIILLLTFGTLEVCSAMYLRQTAKTIAFEGARLGVRAKTTRQAILDECNSLMAARDIAGGQALVAPADFTDIEELDPITVTINAPYNGNTWFLGTLFQSKTAQVSVTMAREYGN